MKKILYKSFVFAFLSTLFLIYPLSLSATVYEKQKTHNNATVLSEKVKTKQNFVQRVVQKIVQKRIEKVLKKQTRRNFEQEKPDQTVGLIALTFMFVGAVLLLLSSGIGFLFLFIALILSIIGLFTEEQPTYSRRTLLISLLLTFLYLILRGR
jgi:uncharacterized membrane protein